MASFFEGDSVLEGLVGKLAAELDAKGKGTSRPPETPAAAAPAAAHALPAISETKAEDDGLAGGAAAGTAAESAGAEGETAGEGSDAMARALAIGKPCSVSIESEEEDVARRLIDLQLLALLDSTGVWRAKSSCECVSTLRCARLLRPLTRVCAPPRSPEDEDAVCLATAHVYANGARELQWLSRYLHRLFLFEHRKLPYRLLIFGHSECPAAARRAPRRRLVTHGSCVCAGVRVRSLRPAERSRFRAGDGAMWDQRNGRVVWVDSAPPAELHAVNPLSGRAEASGLPFDTPCSVVPQAGGDFVIGGGAGMHLWSRESQAARALLPPGKYKGLDGLDIRSIVADRHGQVYAGYVKCGADGAFDRTTTGGILLVQRSGMVVQVAGAPLARSSDGGGGGSGGPGADDPAFGLGCVSGLALSRDGLTLVAVDTASRLVVCFDVDEENGALHSRANLIKVPEEDGPPTCVSIDNESHFWVGHWHTGALTRHSLRTGGVVARVTLPCMNITSVCWGGPVLQDMYVTTSSATWPAVEGMRPAHSLPNPFDKGGWLFRVVFDDAVRVAGIPSYKSNIAWSAATPGAPAAGAAAAAGPPDEASGAAAPEAAPETAPAAAPATASEAVGAAAGETAPADAAVGATEAT